MTKVTPQTINMKHLALILCLIASNVFGQAPALKIGDAAREFSAATPNGNVISLSSLKGKVVLVDFWASWCSPCVKEQPELKALYKDLNEHIKNGSFEILGVSLDKSKVDWQRSINQLHITWPQVSDLKFWKSPIAKDYDIQGLPFNVIVDKNGNIAAMDLHGKELKDFLDGLLDARK